MSFKPLLLALGLGLALVSFIARADDYTEVNRLIRANQTAEALSRSDQFLNTKPRDPQMRFLRGVAQSEMGKNTDAIATFTRLTEDYPELPEPYNNLAVIYANTGQFDKARSALEMAIRTNPSYSTAHENLGDIYAKLASQAYSKALQLDAGNASVPPKLALIRELFVTPTGYKPGMTTGASNLPSPNKATTPAPANPINPVVASTQTKTPTLVTASPTGSNAPNVAPPVVANAVSQRDVEAAVTAWAKAWSERDMKAYLASYTSDFAPKGGGSHAQWEEDRRARIMGKARISVKISSFSARVTGNTASAHFKQDYKADSLAATSRKTLELVNSGGRWLITKEISG